MTSVLPKGDGQNVGFIEFDINSVDILANFKIDIDNANFLSMMLLRRAFLVYVAY